MHQTIFAIAAVLIASAFALSWDGEEFARCLTQHQIATCSEAFN